MVHRMVTVLALSGIAACGSSPTEIVLEDEGTETGGGGGTAVVLPVGSGGAAKQDAGAPRTDSGAGGSRAVDAAPDNRLPSSTACTNAAGVAVTVCNVKEGITLKFGGTNGQGKGPTESKADLAEAGINAVRSFGRYINGATPFDGKTKEQVIADPNVLDWTAVGNYFGTRARDWLAWARDTKGAFLYGVLWAKNKQSSTECADGEMTFRVGNPEDENLIWTMVFGYAYWANVVNDFGASYFELSNEPDNCGGNGTTQVNKDGQNRIMQLGKEAFAYVNQSLVSPPIPAYMMGPGVLTESTGWVSSALSNAATRDALDIVSWHTYWDFHLTAQTEDSAADVNKRTSSGKKQWITEWGQWWHPQGYSDPVVVADMTRVIPKMGLLNIEVNMPWNFYDSEGLQNGLIQSGVKSRLYLELKMLYKALLSEKDMLRTSFENTRDDIELAYATQDATDLYVIYMNNDVVGGDVVVDLSQVPGTEGKTVQISGVGDTAFTRPDTTVSGGRFTLKKQGGEHYVAKITGAGAP